MPLLDDQIHTLESRVLDAQLFKLSVWYRAINFYALFNISLEP